jgi:voltage-gated potassium channel
MNLRQRLRLAGFMLLGILAVAVAGYMFLGRSSLLDAVYMAIITVAGVGYGEIIPTEHNTALRIFNMFVVVIGVTVTVYVFSVVTAFLVEGEIRNLFWRRKMQKRINELREHFIICGLGDTGRYAVDEMRRTGTPYVVIESHEDVIKKFHEQAATTSEDLLYVIGDATDEAVLDQAGVNKAKGLISALSGDKDNLVTTLMARQKNSRIRIVSRCTDLKYSDRMVKAGANSTVSPNRIGGMRLASEALRPHVVGFLDLMLKEHSRTLRIEEIDVAAGSPWAGSSLTELNLRSRFKLLVLATKSSAPAADQSDFHPNPPDDERVEAGSVIIVMGDVSDIRNARNDAQHGQRRALAVK